MPRPRLAILLTYSHRALRKQTRHLRCNSTLEISSTFVLSERRRIPHPVDRNRFKAPLFNDARTLVQESQRFRAHWPMSEGGRDANMALARGRTYARR